MMWIGYAEEHFVELDFGQQFSSMDPNDPIALMLAGWIEYPYSQTNWAATTAGAELRTPVLEWLNEEGRWETLESNLGYFIKPLFYHCFCYRFQVKLVVRRECG